MPNLDQTKPAASMFTLTTSAAQPGPPSPLPAPSLQGNATPTPSTRTASIVGLQHALDGHLHLPNDARSFFIYVSGLVVVCVGMTLQVWLPAQLLRTRVELAELQAQFSLMERQNSELVWQIAQASNLGNLRERAASLGYTVAPERLYVVMPAPPALAGLAPDEASSSLTKAADRSGASGSEEAEPWRPALLAELFARLHLPASTMAQRDVDEVSSVGRATRDTTRSWRERWEQAKRRVTAVWDNLTHSWEMPNVSSQ